MEEYLDNNENLKEVVEFINLLKPEWNVSAQHIDNHGGKGFLCESIFAFFRCKNFWIVQLCDGRFAFKEISSEWIEIVSNIVLESPHIFIQFDRHHRIISWTALQEKTPVQIVQ